LCNGVDTASATSSNKTRWHVEQLPDGSFRWITSSGRPYITEPTRYPI